MTLYLDTSAFIKLYVRESGSVEVNEMIAANSEPLVIWDLHRIEFYNALRLKVFRNELGSEDADLLIRYFQTRSKEGIYYTPMLDRKDHVELCLEFTAFSMEIGCRSLDIMHVGAARLFEADKFVTFDEKQAVLARKAGLSVSVPER